jgi:hypothetical protein
MIFGSQTFFTDISSIQNFVNQNFIPDPTTPIALSSYKCMNSYNENDNLATF